MPLPVTALYAALLALLFLVLSLLVIRQRYRSRIALGGGERLLERAIRAQGNCAEYLPPVLLLLGLLEGLGAASAVLHGLGACFLAGRILHAVGISREPEVLYWRSTGMALTFGVLGIAAALLLGLALRTLTA